MIVDDGGLLISSRCPIVIVGPVNHIRGSGVSSTLEFYVKNHLQFNSLCFKRKSIMDILFDILRSHRLCFLCI